MSAYLAPLIWPITAHTLRTSISLVSAVVPPAHAHASLDLLVAAIKGPTVTGPYYSDGFGRANEACAIARRVLHGTLRGGLDAPPFLRVHLEPSEHGQAHAHVAEGSFAAPAAHTLPAASAVARFQLVTPIAWLNAASSATRPVVILLPGTGEHGFHKRRHCLAYPLAAAGIASVIVEGAYYGTRRPVGIYGSKLRALSDLLLMGFANVEEARGLTRWLRGRSHEDVVRTVCDLPSSAAAAASPLLKRGTSSAVAREVPSRLEAPLPSGGGVDGDGIACGGHGVIVLGGTSMGGLHAALAAGLLPREWHNVGIASWLGPPSACGVFTRGTLAAACDWGALAAAVKGDAAADGSLSDALASADALLALAPDVPHSGPPDAASLDALAVLHPTLLPTSSLPRLGGAAALSPAADAVARLLALSDLPLYPPPPRPGAATFVTAAHDAYVPVDGDTAALWRYVQSSWGGGGGGRPQMLSLNAGHVTGALAFSENVEMIRGVVARVC